MIPLTGYADRFSVGPGETIAFKVSSTASTPYQARLVRVICGDPNPAGPGIREEDVSAVFAGTYPSRLQPVPLGSYARVPSAAPLQGLTSFSLGATIWPTTPQHSQQGILARYDPGQGTGFALFIDAQGAGACVGMGHGQVRHVRVGKPLRERAWYRIWASYDASTQTLSVGQVPLQPAFMVDETGSQTLRLETAPRLDTPVPLLIAALGGAPVRGHYNGKIERPLVLDRAVSATALLAALTVRRPEHLVALWDFSQDISSPRIVDIGPHGLHGETVNLPARAMTGSNWTGTEMCWRHAPEQYGAIHFHDDDLYDCGWEADFTFTIPGNLKSGVYAMRLTCGTVSDMLPFFVRPQRGQPQSTACVLLPTFTYTVYSFDGQYGGLWRRNGRPPQQLTGVGFTSQGRFEGSYYRRQPAARDPRVAWIFDGVEDDVLGDFGLSGGGAAGFELDRADSRLGTPAHTLVLATSEGHNPENFILVHEEQLGLFTTWPRVPAAQLICADMGVF